MSCTYYGQNGMHFALLPTGGNQCGLIVTAYTPCMMETNGLEVDENACPLARAKKEGVRIMPDPGQPSEHHRKIVSTKPIPHTKSGHWIVLECGHHISTFGPLDIIPEHGVFCEQCWQDAVKERHAKS